MGALNTILKKDISCFPSKDWTRALNCVLGPVLIFKKKTCRGFTPSVEPIGCAERSRLDLSESSHILLLRLGRMHSETCAGPNLNRREYEVEVATSSMKPTAVRSTHA